MEELSVMRIISVSQIPPFSVASLQLLRHNLIDILDGAMVTVIEFWDNYGTHSLKVVETHKFYGHPMLIYVYT